jgi:HSP20 family protein
MDNEQFFENIAAGKTAAEDNNADTATGASSENELGNYEANGAFEVELAKASTVAARTIRTRAGDKEEETPAHAWEDDGTEGQLTVDVYQTPEDIVVESAIAGVKPEDIDVNVTSDSISIHGTRHHGKEVKDEDYLYQECYWGRFARSIILPQEIDPDAAEVMFKNGILTIRLPKVNKKKTKKLRVRVD